MNTISVYEPSVIVKPYNGNWAVKKTRSILEQDGFSVKVLNTDVDVKIIASKNGEVHRIEAELWVKNKFDSKESFPFKEVNFLFRKKEFRRKGEFLYIIVSPTTGCMIGMRSEDIYTKGVYNEKPCDSVYKMGNDKFYSIPKDECNFFKDKIPSFLNQKPISLF